MLINFDLFGLPLREKREDAGRPSHEPTDKNRNKIMVLFALGWTKETVAEAIGLSMPTFRKYYFSEIKLQDIALLRVKGRHVERLWAKAETGDVGAMKEIGKMLDRVELTDLAEQVRASGFDDRPKHAKLGKKEQQRVAASEVKGLYAPRSGPRVN